MSKIALPRKPRSFYRVLMDNGATPDQARRALRFKRKRLIHEPLPPDWNIRLDFVDAPTLLDEKQSELTVTMRPDCLSERAIVNAQPLEREYTIWDGCAGLGLRVRPSGAKSYIVAFRIRGQANGLKITLGKAGLISLAQAREMARNHQFTARMGDDPRKEILLRADVARRVAKEMEYNRQLGEERDASESDLYHQLQDEKRAQWDEELMREQREIDPDVVL